MPIARKALVLSSLDTGLILAAPLLSSFYAFDKLLNLFRVLAISFFRAILRLLSRFSLSGYSRVAFMRCGIRSCLLSSACG